MPVNAPPAMVNEVTSPTPCELHILLGIHGRTKQVAKAKIILGSDLFHGTPIPSETLRRTHRHPHDRGDPPPLGQSVDEFILWNKCYIRNIAVPQEKQPLALEHGAADDEASDFLPPDPPIQGSVPSPL